MTTVRVEHSPAIVIGSGIAGLSTALALGNCTLLTASTLGEGGSSRWAQGGVAAAIGGADSPADHAADTLGVGAGLGDASIVGLVTGLAPQAIAEMVARGARFDRGDDHAIALGREAGHRERRIVHSNGDATGAELIRTLVEAVLDEPRIRRVEGARLVDLVCAGVRVAGVVAWHVDGAVVVHLAPAVVLATGGYGHCFAHTTTPDGVCGDGIAIAARAGVTIADMEFVQFHPTALAAGGDPLPLLTESLRGEGAVLVDETGVRYVLSVDPEGELAPRDIVARANYRWSRDGHDTFLDARCIGEHFPKRFPTVFGLCAGRGLDPRRDLLPVSPAAHYTMGGVYTVGPGRTSRPGLWAVGEVSASGLHGANRLASNSMLEGLVLGKEAAVDILAVTAAAPGPEATFWVSADAWVLESEEPAVSARLRELLWEGAGVERDGDGLRTLQREIAGLAHDAGCSVSGRNQLLIASLVADAALARTESRGAHFRTDYPHDDAEQASRRTVRLPPVNASALRLTPGNARIDLHMAV